MKRLYIFLVSLSLGSYAQVSTNTTPKFLDKNRVKARVYTVNTKSWDAYGGQGPSYEVPKGKSTHAQFANSIWIGGLDPGGQLHIAANTYRQAGVDFWPGPLDTSNISSFTNSNIAAYNKLWKVDCNDINNFVTAYNAGWVAAGTYTVPPDILNYPAKGTANFQKNLEPFFDANGNGLYNPATEGDYPLIKGHQQILSIYNDQYSTHTESGGAPMGVEIHERSYAYYDATLPDSMKAVNHSTFYHYTIYNRSNTRYNNVYISDWSDVDLGYFLDDYIGTDTLNNFTYCYNGDANDQTAMGIVGYGTMPPVVSHALIKTPCTTDGIDNDGDGLTDEAGEQFRLNVSTYYNNNIGSVLPQTSNPSVAQHFYGYMSGYWKDGTPFTYGGTGYGGNQASRYVYPGNPATNSGWTEGSASNAPGDRRVISSSGPFTLPAGGRIEWSYAVVFSQDTTQAVNTIAQFNSRVRRDVRNVRLYDSLYNSPQCTPQVSLALSVKEDAEKIVSQAYPNPTSGTISFYLREYASNAAVTVWDIAGRKMKETQLITGNEAIVDLSMLDKGVYLVEISSNGKKAVERVVKE